MAIDSRTNPTYTDYMKGDGAHIRLKLDTDQPIALGDFVGAFVGLGSQFEKFVAHEYPAFKADSEFFVKDVRDGCIVAELVTMIGLGGMSLLAEPAVVNAIDRAQILSKFVGDLRDKIGKYFKPGGRAPTATKSDVVEWAKIVGGTARDPKASARLEAAYYEDGERKIRSMLVFTANEARTAEHELGAHRRELEAKTDDNHSRVLLRFVRPSIEGGKPGKTTGERAIIDKIHLKPLPVVYASDLAEQRIHDEMRLADDNIFRKLFDVDVNVEMSASEKPRAYRIKHVHTVIDSEDAA